MLIFTRTAVHALAGKKKIAILEQLKDACASRSIDLKLYLKSKGDGGVPQMEELIAALEGEDASAAIVGTFTKEKPQGTFADAWSAKLESSGLPVVDVGEGIGGILANKDADEIVNVKKACGDSSLARILVRARGAVGSVGSVGAMRPILPQPARVPLADADSLHSLSISLSLSRSLSLAVQCPRSLIRRRSCSLAPWLSRRCRRLKRPQIRTRRFRMMPSRPSWPPYVLVASEPIVMVC